jgi:hypothetical protein
MWIVQFSSECSSTSSDISFTYILHQLNAYRNTQQILTTGLQKKLYYSEINSQLILGSWFRTSFSTYV